MGLAVSFFSSYVHLVVSIFLRSCLGVSIFRKAKGLEVPIRSFICFYKWRLPASLDIEFQWSNLQFSEKKLILTSPIANCLNSTKNYKTYRNVRFGARKTVIFL